MATHTSHFIHPLRTIEFGRHVVAEVLKAGNKLGREFRIGVLVAMKRPRAQPLPTSCKSASQRCGSVRNTFSAACRTRSFFSDFNSWRISSITAGLTSQGCQAGQTCRSVAAQPHSIWSEHLEVNVQAGARVQQPPQRAGQWDSEHH